MIEPAQFLGQGGWMGYLQKNLNVELANKHIKIPKGEKSATKMVMVTFIVSDKGRVLSPQVINPKEVHPKLAEEAIRVVSASPLWKPATAFGEKIIFRFNQPITFETRIE